MTTKQQVKPTAKQLEYQAWEFGMFIHFGLRTFYEGYVDFDARQMDPMQFNPTNLDCEQWIRTAKEAGMKYAVMTAKHHDGFSNWPSAYTDFSVAQSPWKNGQGDVVEEFILACRKRGVKPGLYYSPYDGSADFYDHHSGKAYDDYFINQITELLTNYGDIEILWFDGAGSEDHEYDWERIIRTIRNLQPNILIFNMADPDFRWVGNEDGIAPIPCWNEVDTIDLSIYANENKQLKEHLWLPVECDVQMRGNWFYSAHDEHTVKCVDELMGIYYHSVGRGANLLLNIGPDREGKLPEKDTHQLLAFGQEINRRFSHPIATIDQWEKQDNKWVYKTEDAHLLDHIVIEEDLKDGECVHSFHLKILTQKTRQPVTIYEGRNIGNKAMIRIPPVKVCGVIIEITNHTGNPLLKEISIYHTKETE
jgi:alpha-L-fucosidase